MPISVNSPPTTFRIASCTYGAVWSLYRSQFEDSWKKAARCDRSYRSFSTSRACDQPSLYSHLHIEPAWTSNCLGLKSVEKGHQLLPGFSEVSIYILPPCRRICCCINIQIQAVLNPSQSKIFLAQRMFQFLLIKKL